jgi:hypothetical protein
MPLEFACRKGGYGDIAHQINFALALKEARTLSRYGRRN